MAILMPNPRQQYFDANGPLDGGKVYTYEVGSSTRKATYSDSAGTVQNANPVVLDAIGSAAIFWTGAYKVVVKDADDNLIYSLDNYVTSESDSGQISANVKAYGAVGDGVTDDTAAVMAAVAAMTSNSALYFPGGTYLVNDTIDLTEKNGVSLLGDGMDSTVIKRTDGGFGDTILWQRTDPTTNQIHGLTIRDLTLYAAVDVSTGATIHVKNCTRFNTDRVFIRNGHRGLHTEGIRDSKLNGLEIIMGEFYTVDRATACHVLIDAPADTSKVSTETYITNFNWTTAGNAGDVDACLRIQGALDGIWFNNGHMFGGKTAGCLIDGNSQSAMSGLTFNHVWFDQFTPMNLLVQGTATANFRLLSFKACRFWGGTTRNITLDSGSNIQDVTFDTCEIGVTPGQGVRAAAGKVEFKTCQFKAINQSAAANGYALQIPGTLAADTEVSVVGGSTFEMSNLTYGIQCSSSVATYHLHDSVFRNQDGSIVAEIYYNSATLNGSCSGNHVNRTAASDIAAAASTRHTNIATDSWNLTGATVAITTLEPKWHGRRVTLKADTNSKTLDSGGNIRNRLNAASVTIAAEDIAFVEYSEDSARFHGLQ